MSGFNATPDSGAGAAPDAGAAAPTPAAPATNEPPAVNPAWDKALENIPEAWQTSIREQIRVSEQEAQRAIEQARQASVPDSWRDFYSQAQQVGLSPEDFIGSYQGQQQLYQQLMTDPDQFLADISAEIDRQVAAGQLTRKAGQQAKAQAASDVDDLLTPEAKRLQELEEWKTQQEQQQIQAQQSWQQQEIERQQTEIADNAAAEFMDTLENAFAADPSIAGASDEIKYMAGQIASSFLDNDRTGKMTYEQAVGQALNMLRQAVGWQGAPAGAQPLGQQPNAAAAIGGGAPGFQQQQPTTFDLKTAEGRDARDAWLVEQAKVMFPNAE